MPVPRGSFWLAPRYRPALEFRTSRRRAHRPARPGLVLRGARPGVVEGRRHQVLPSSLETRMNACPARRPRWREEDSIRLSSSPFAFRVSERVGRTHDKTVFGAQSRGPRSRCVRFTSTVTRRGATLAAGWWDLTLSGRDSHPLGFCAEFLFWISYILDSSRPGLSWRTRQAIYSRPSEKLGFDCGEGLSPARRVVSGAGVS